MTTVITIDVSHDRRRLLHAARLFDNDSQVVFTGTSSLAEAVAIRNLITLPTLTQSQLRRSLMIDRNT